MPTMLLLLVLTISGSLTGVLSEECGTGKYSSNVGCKECPSSCEKCLSEFHCQECKPGFYGEACSKTCSNICKNGLCSKDTGKCVSCADGYFQNDNSTCESCREHCTVCDSETRCAICAVGFKGDLCQETCTNCKPGTGCSKDTGICSDGCTDGYSGISCSTKCNSICISCNRQDPDACWSCASDRYGPKCETPCPKNCLENTCNTHDGMCTHGCQSGFWGSLCQLVCPNKCKENKCFRHNGFCLDGCIDNYSGSNCDCPSGCTCASNGTCERCSQESEFVCYQSCSEGCVESVCRKDTNECIHYCRGGDNGEHCSAIKGTKDDTRQGAGSSRILLIAVLVPVVTLLIIVAVIGIRFIRNMCRTRGKTGSEDRIEGDQKSLTDQSSPLRQPRRRLSVGYLYSQLPCVSRQEEKAEYAATGETEEILLNTDNSADAVDVDTENTEQKKTLLVSLCENKDSVQKVDVPSDDTYDKTFAVHYNKSENTIKYATWSHSQEERENKDILLKQDRRRKSLEEESMEKELEHPIYNKIEDGLCPLIQEICETKDFSPKQERKREDSKEKSLDMEFEHPKDNKTEKGFCPRIQENPNLAEDVSTDGSNNKNADTDNTMANNTKHATSYQPQKIPETMDNSTKTHSRRESLEEESLEKELEHPVHNKTQDVPCSLVQKRSKSKNIPREQDKRHECVEKEMKQPLDKTTEEGICSLLQGLSFEEAGSTNSCVDITFNENTYIEKSTQQSNQELPKESTTSVGATINMRKLEKRILKMQKENLFAFEFQQLPGSATNKIESTVNRSKQSSDTLKAGPTHYLTTYFIKGYTHKKCYIACSGQTSAFCEVTPYFWSMIWEKKCYLIVMLTDNVKEKHWSEEVKSSQYGEVKVTYQKPKYFDNFVKRNIIIEKGSTKMRRVIQLQYTSWPENGVPANPGSLVDFRQHQNKIQLKSNSHILVHCSDGVGRTGTYIALDILIEEAKRTNSVNVFACVELLRKQRTFTTEVKEDIQELVQSPEQYTFLHHALLYWYQHYGKQKEVTTNLAV